MDAAGSQRAAVDGVGKGALSSFSLDVPGGERVSALSCTTAYPRCVGAGLPDRLPEDVWEEVVCENSKENGAGARGGMHLYAVAPDRARHPVFSRAHGRWERLSASRSAVALQAVIRGSTCEQLLSDRYRPLVVYRSGGRRRTTWSVATWGHTFRTPKASITRAIDTFRTRGPGCDPRRDRGIPQRRSSRACARSRWRTGAVHRHRFIAAARRCPRHDRWTRMLEPERCGGRARGRDFIEVAEYNTTGDGMLGHSDAARAVARCAEAHLAKAVR